MNKRPVLDFDPIFKCIPQLEGLDCNKTRITKLPGYTNQNFRLVNGAQDWVLRIPKIETNQYINRQFEAHNAEIAETLEIAPKCAWRDQSGLSLTLTLNRTRPITLNDIKRESIFRQLVKVIRSLHDCNKSFQGQVDLADLLAQYYRLVPASQRQLTSGVYEVAQTKIEKLLTRHSRLRPSHNDLVLENILIDDSDRIWIIDWEYSSMASPYWDLATVCNAMAFDRNQSSDFLKTYQQQGPTGNLELLIDYRYVLQVLSICWMAAFTKADIESQIQSLSKDPGFEASPARGTNRALI
ncbi:MAG: phosphotransferase [Gammaproteobacteria bacterium]